MPQFTGIKRPLTQVGRMSKRHSGLSDYTRSRATLSGTIVATPTETQVKSGGTVIITLKYNTWVAAGATFNAARQAIINGLDSAGAEAAGWDAQVKGSLAVGTVVRTSSTVVTITVPTTSGYSITADEIITATIPDSAMQETTDSSLVATSTLTIAAD